MRLNRLLMKAYTDAAAAGVDTDTVYCSSNYTGNRLKLSGSVLQISALLLKSLVYVEYT